MDLEKMVNDHAANAAHDETLTLDPKEVEHRRKAAEKRRLTAKRNTRIANAMAALNVGLAIATLAFDLPKEILYVSTMVIAPAATYLWGGADAAINICEGDN